MRFFFSDQFGFIVFRALHILIIESKRGQRMKLITLWKLIGISVFAFGLGILVSFFLPDRALAVIETVIIVAVGLLFLLRPKC